MRRGRRARQSRDVLWGSESQPHREHSQCQDANGPLPTARGTEWSEPSTDADDHYYLTRMGPSSFVNVSLLSPLLNCSHLHG